MLTIGHSNRTIEAFVALLKAHGVTHLVDVRTVPRSRHNPQFNADDLPATLRAHGIAHTSMKALGGLRKPRPDSPNRAWRNESFRGYADCMQTPEFAEALDALIALERDGGRVAIMCAEAVPWRCHRSLIADALTARGVTVAHILEAPEARPHTITPFARIEETRVTYPAGDLFDEVDESTD